MEKKNKGSEDEQTAWVKQNLTKQETVYSVRPCCEGDRMQVCVIRCVR